jgi:hypothetical protein
LAEAAAESSTVVYVLGYGGMRYASWPHYGSTDAISGRGGSEFVFCGQDGEAMPLDYFPLAIR